MSITIDNPTAEAIYAALQKMPPAEVTRLRAMLNDASDETLEAEEAAWYQASAASADRFFEEEEKH